MYRAMYRPAYSGIQPILAVYRVYRPIYRYTLIQPYISLYGPCTGCTGPIYRGFALYTVQGLYYRYTLDLGLFSLYYRYRLNTGLIPLYQPYTPYSAYTGIQPILAVYVHIPIYSLYTMYQRYTVYRPCTQGIYPIYKPCTQPCITGIPCIQAQIRDIAYIHGIRPMYRTWAVHRGFPLYYRIYRPTYSIQGSSPGLGLILEQHRQSS